MDAKAEPAMTSPGGVCNLMPKNILYGVALGSPTRVHALDQLRDFARSRSNS
jgi:hypothetical protein